MTIKELIEELKKFDANLIITYNTPEDTYEPSPSEQLYDFDTSYYNGKSFITIPKGTKFVSL